MLKRPITFVLTIFLFVIYLHGFSQNQKKFNIGIKTGMDFSFFNTKISEYGVDESLEFKPSIRWFPSIGLFGKFHLTNWFAIRAEAQWAGKGGAYRVKADVISTGGDTKDNYYYQNFLLNYCELPILLDFSTMLKGDLITLGFGFSPMFNTGSKIRYNYYNENSHQSSAGYTAVNENFKTIDFDYAKKRNYSWIVDLSYDRITDNNIGVSVGLRYSQTIDNVYRVNSLDGFNMKSKMGTISFVMAFYI